ncbi:MAG: hypothetical protein LPJ95_02235 [Paracoccaceae bacterium]|nr:hypothetical protein [Paracoccaceae bacterium]
MKHICAAAALALSVHPALADPLEDRMVAFATQEARAWFVVPMVVKAVQDANLAHAALGAEEIAALDARWSSEGGTKGGLVEAVTANATSAYLRDLVEGSEGKVTELILMDARGLNVALSGLTSDYWQGDEDKHRLTFGAGPTGLHVSDVDLDESTQTYQAQISFALTDPATGLPIGAVTVGLNAESF